MYEQNESVVEVSKTEKFTINAIPDREFQNRQDARHIRKTFKTQHYVGDVTSRNVPSDLRACLDRLSVECDKGSVRKFRLVFLEWIDLTSEEMIIMLSALSVDYCATYAVIVVGRHICYFSMLQISA